MTEKEVNKLIKKYLEGKTSPEEEYLLKQEVNSPDAPTEWKIVSDMLGELSLGEAVYDDIIRKRKRRKITIKMGWGVAATVALVFVLGTIINKIEIPEKENIAIAYINGEKVTDEKLAMQMSEDALCEIFSNSESSHDELYEIFNPE